jgi:hypothetical protein
MADLPDVIKQLAELQVREVRRRLAASEKRVKDLQTLRTAHEGLKATNAAVKEELDGLRDPPSTPFGHRTVVRPMCAAIEAITYQLKVGALAAAPFNGVRFTPAQSGHKENPRQL